MRLVTVREAAYITGLSLNTIRRAADNGLLRTSRTPGGHRRFTLKNLSAFVKSLEEVLVPNPLADYEEQTAQS